MTRYLKNSLSFIQGIVDCINKNDKLAMLIVFVFTICYKLYFISDGIAFPDPAFYLSYSMNLDDAMKYSAMKTAPFYLTAVVSHIFLKFFSAKLLGLRVLQIINYLFLFYLVFKFYKNKIPNICVLSGTLISLIILCGRPVEFYYDDFSASMCVLSIFLMVKSIDEKCKKYIFFSGFVFALNIFVRLPNVIYLVMAAYIFLFIKDSEVSVLKYLFAAFGGFVLGILLFFLLLYLRGDLLNFHNGLVRIIRLSQDSGDTHNVSDMLRFCAWQIKKYY